MLCIWLSRNRQMPHVHVNTWAGRIGDFSPVRLNTMVISLMQKHSTTFCFQSIISYIMKKTEKVEKWWLNAVNSATPFPLFFSKLAFPDPRRKWKNYNQSFFFLNTWKLKMSLISTAYDLLAKNGHWSFKIEKET